VALENTHNRAGGTVFPQETAVQVCASARERGLATYLDGARLWNAAAATETPLATLAAPFDLVSVALSKGLGAPGGSLLAGDHTTVRECTRYRRMQGGAMRQVGIFAAAGLYALDHNLERLAEDHENARAFAERLADCRGIAIDLDSVQTNIVIFELDTSAQDATSVVNAAAEQGVLMFAFGPRTIRAVTHLEVTGEDCRRAADVVAGVVDQLDGARR
jgi:threonine aldolase